MCGVLLLEMLIGARNSEPEHEWRELSVKHMYTDGMWPGSSMGARFLKRIWGSMCAFAGANSLCVLLDACCSGARDLSPPCNVLSGPRFRDTRANMRFVGVILRLCRVRAPCL